MQLRPANFRLRRNGRIDFQKPRFRNYLVNNILRFFILTVLIILTEYEKPT